jgi:protein-glutamine gamma-glutamyltransferase
VVDRSAPALNDPSRVALGSERVAAWAREVGGGSETAQDSERVCRRIETFLATRFQYSLLVPPSGPRPIEQFLFESRSGHCENFASAMALSLRELGIPTRFVTGFSGGEIGLFGRFVVVRGRDAHAWVEAWCGPERGWVSFDPTPAEGRPLLHEAPFSRRLFQVTDGVEFLYDRFILSFGQGDQIELIRRLREAAGTFADVLKKGIATLRAFRLHGPSRSWRAVAIFAASALAVLALILLSLWRFGFGFRFGRPAVPPASAAYRRLQRLLRRRGRVLTPSSAPSETLAAAATFGEPAKRLSREIVLAYIEESFGGREAGPAKERRLNFLVNEVKSAIREARASGRVSSH